VSPFRKRPDAPEPPPRVANGAPTISAQLDDGPLEGRVLPTATVEGRPPKTIDVDDPGDGACRYCLAQWSQSGAAATYTFLYRV
jgi:hypothetical protein